MRPANVPLAIALIVVIAASLTIALIACVVLPLVIVSKPNTIASSTSLVIDTTNGRVSGWERISRGGRIFQCWAKIPYGKPPVDRLRFQPPEPSDKWDGILDATQNSPACMQTPFKRYGVDAEMSEDCLHLNIYRPKIRPPILLPVLIYIHGGAYEHGMVSRGENADYIMDEDVILIEISYRLTGFGFMGLNDDVMPGNYGMKDQVLSLKWIKYNIKAFGGDPDSITLFGESAGGSSAHLLMKSPLSRDLVTRAVSHSGSINPTWSSTPGYYIRKQTLATAKYASCDMNSSAAILSCLQNLTETELVQAINGASRWPFMMDFNPVIEPTSIKEAFASEDLSLVPSEKPWITTFTNGEYTVFMDMLDRKKKEIEMAYHNWTAVLENEILSHVKSPAKKQAGAATIMKVYFPELGSIDEFTVQCARMFGDYYFSFPALHNAMNHKGPTWISHLEYTPALKAKPNEISTHAANIWFYFNHTGEYPEMTTPEFIAASKRMIKYLVNFAYYSNPNSPDLPNKWPQFKTNEIFRQKREKEFVSDQLAFDYFKMMNDMWFLAEGWD